MDQGKWNASMGLSQKYFKTEINMLKFSLWKAHPGCNRKGEWSV